MQGRMVMMFGGFWVLAIYVCLICLFEEEGDIVDGWSFAGWVLRNISHDCFYFTSLY